MNFYEFLKGDPVVPILIDLIEIYISNLFLS